MELPEDRATFYRLVRERGSKERAELLKIVYLGAKTWSIRYCNGSVYRLKDTSSGLSAQRIKRGV